MGLIVLESNKIFRVALIVIVHHKNWRIRHLIHHRIKQDLWLLRVSWRRLFHPGITLTILPYQDPSKVHSSKSADLGLCVALWIRGISCKVRSTTVSSTCNRDEKCTSVVTIQMKATEQYFPVVLFIMLYKVVLTFESVDEILKCDHSNESYWAVFSCGPVYYAVQGGPNFWVCGWNPKVWPFKCKLLSSTFLWWCLLCCTRWFYLLSLWMKP